MLSPPIFNKISTPNSAPAIMKKRPSFLIAISVPEVFLSAFRESIMAIEIRKIITAIQKWFASRLNLLNVMYSRSPGERAAISQKAITPARITHASSFAF